MVERRGRPSHRKSGSAPTRSNRRRSSAAIDTRIANECRRIARKLMRDTERLVLAESCTAGMVAASLASIPGISEYFCGSAVTYRNETKHAWLRIPRRVLEQPGAVSDLVARKMAERALRITPEADWAASVTGHFGPHAPVDLDGILFVGIARRNRQSVWSRVHRYRLSGTSRTERQREATMLVLAALRNDMSQFKNDHQTLWENLS